MNAIKIAKICIRRKFLKYSNIVFKTHSFSFKVPYVDFAVSTLVQAKFCKKKKKNSSCSYSQKICPRIHEIELFDGKSNEEKKRDRENFFCVLMRLFDCFLF